MSAVIKRTLVSAVVEMNNQEILWKKFELEKKSLELAKKLAKEFEEEDAKISNDLAVSLRLDDDGCIASESVNNDSELDFAIALSLSVRDGDKKREIKFHGVKEEVRERNLEFKGVHYERRPINTAIQWEDFGSQAIDSHGDLQVNLCFFLSIAKFLKKNFHQHDKGDFRRLAAEIKRNRISTDSYANQDDIMNIASEYGIRIVVYCPVNDKEEIRYYFNRNARNGEVRVRLWKNHFVGERVSD